MTTFTFRTTSDVASRISSSQVRDWLVTFLRQPHPLPHDPSPGPARVSLTLPEGHVDAVAAHLRCSASSALRRITAERLAAPRQAEAPRQRVTTPSTASSATMSGQTAWKRPPATHQTPSPALRRSREVTHVYSSEVTHLIS
jgi:hypothetical protein